MRGLRVTFEPRESLQVFFLLFFFITTHRNTRSPSCEIIHCEKSRITAITPSLLSSTKKKYRIMLRYRDKSRYIDRFSVRRKHLRGRKIPSFLFFVKIADEHESNEQFLAVERRGRPASSSFPLHNFACTASYCRISSREETGERETVTKRNR